jgi:hypothetical protein
MTMYDDNRVVTLLREIDPPLSPPDRLQDVRRRARRGESRRATALAGVMAVVLAAGVIAAVQLPGRGTEVLSVAGAARATKATGSAVVTFRATVTHSTQAALPDGDLFTLSGPVDFKRARFAFTGSFGGQKLEMRGIGKDRWNKSDLTTLIPGVSHKPWVHSVDTAPVSGLNGVGNADPGELLDALISKGTVLSSRQLGDGTRTVLRLPADVLGSGFGGTSQPATDEVTVDSDADGRIRLLTSETAAKELGTIRVTMAFDQFGIEVDVQPPPADQVSEAPPSTGTSGTSEHFTVTTGSSSSPEDRKKACDTLKAFLKRQPAPKTDQEKAQRKQFEQAFAQACATS